MKKALSLMLAVALFACLLIPAMQVSAATEYVCYISAAGDDATAEIGSEAKPYKTLSAAATALAAKTFVDGDTVKMVVIGTVEVDNRQPLLTSATKATELNANQILCVRDADSKPVLNEDKTAKLIPVTVEGKDSTSTLNFANRSGSTTRAYPLQQVTFKNLKFTASFAADVDKYMWLQPSIGTMTFDNVTFDSTGCDWKISAQCMSGTPYTKILGVAADVQCDNTVIFKNGDYTNLHTVAVLWTYSTKIDVTAAQIAAFDPGITVEGTAKMNTVYGLATQTMAKGSSGSYDLPTACRNPEILIKSGATVAKVIGTLDNKEYTNNLTITIEQGANVTTVAEKGEGATVTGNIVVNNANTGSTTPETPAPETPAPETPAPSTPATADASEIVLFSFIALASLAGVAVVSKTRA